MSTFNFIGLFLITFQFPPLGVVAFTVFVFVIFFVIGFWRGWKAYHHDDD